MCLSSDIGEARGNCQAAPSANDLLFMADDSICSGLAVDLIHLSWCAGLPRVNIFVEES